MRDTPGINGLAVQPDSSGVSADSIWVRTIRDCLLSPEKHRIRFYLGRPFIQPRTLRGSEPDGGSSESIPPTRSQLFLRSVPVSGISRKILRVSVSSVPRSFFTTLGFLSSFTRPGSFFAIQCTWDFVLFNLGEKRAGHQALYSRQKHFRAALPAVIYHSTVTTVSPRCRLLAPPHFPPFLRNCLRS